MNLLKVIKITLTVLAVTALGFSQENVHQVASRVDQHYNSLQTLVTQFTEVYSGAGMARTESGTLWLKRPGRMRWEYGQPREKLFVTDGRTAWFYVPGEKQAQKMQLKKLDDLRTPLAYLLGRTRLEKEFTNLSLAPDARASRAGNVVLRGIPRNMADRVSDVLMEIAPNGQFLRILAHEVDGTTTEFRFANQKENVAVSDGRFKFVPPPGVEIMQASELGQ